MGRDRARPFQSLEVLRDAFAKAAIDSPLGVAFVLYFHLALAEKTPRTGWTWIFAGPCHGHACGHGRGFSAVARRSAQRGGLGDPRNGTPGRDYQSVKFIYHFANERSRAAADHGSAR